MLRVRAEVTLQLAEALLAVREEHQLLVVPHALTVEHRGQVSSGLRVVAPYEPEPLGWPICRHRLVHDRDEVCLLVVPAPEVAAIQADDDRRRGLGQARARIGTAVDREGRLGAEFGLDPNAKIPPRYLSRLPADG
jgi:hypothetical protein